MLFLSLLLHSVFSFKPIIIIPSHFGSRLHTNTTRRPYWYCPKSLNNRHVWIRVRDLFPPFVHCVLDYLTVELDPKTGNLTSRHNTTISTVDFGGVSGIKGIGPEYFGKYLPVNYEEYIKSFLEIGYEVRKDLFSAPYDWRYGLEQPDEYFEQLQQLIEHAYRINQNSKVAILAHGHGATLAHMFLTDRMTADWRKKFIDSSTYVAPSWSGSGQAFFALWRLRFPFVHVRFNSLRRFVGSLGAFHSQIPNSVAYANTTLLISPDGKNHTGDELIDILKKHGKLTPEQLEIAEKNFKYTKVLPKRPDFNVNILYNSGVPTPLGLHLRNWTDVGMPIYGRGDSLMGSKVIDWACDNWRTAGVQLRCHDVFSDERKYHHRYLLKTPEMAHLIRSWIVKEYHNGKNAFSEEL
ncbi:Lecithin:cholesterol acyltransferase family protein [Tritrichomonas foetus]|uniref:Lecithin:cholesterol acyltransferase family protein n=1 Tax=Tritrichomonas foetus TaxID=1144522 RepID=A0A1J4JAH3_9EUKA|nr:Lecithin:cholesterol acyltransferase family protein [Tritrichomonas foetus]|eukprot:OHS94445.1 Lecithin:cholesterol acyltransferase family protein [Tritrichomonas foetus]